MDLFKAIFAESSSEDDSADSDDENAVQAAGNKHDSVPRTSDIISGAVAKEKKWQDLSAITNTLLPVGETLPAQSYGKNTTKSAVHSESEKRRSSSHENSGWSSNQTKDKDVGLLGVRGADFVRGRDHNRSSSTNHHDSGGHHHGNTGHRHGNDGSRSSKSMQQHGSHEDRRERHKSEPRLSRLSKGNEDKGGGGGGGTLAGEGVTQLSVLSQQPGGNSLEEGCGRSGLFDEAQQTGNSAPPDQPTSYGPALPKGKHCK